MNKGSMPCLNNGESAQEEGFFPLARGSDAGTLTDFKEKPAVQVKKTRYWGVFTIFKQDLKRRTDKICPPL